MCLSGYSREEANVSSSHSLVGISHTWQDPLGKGLALSARAEEVVEHCRIYWLDGLLREVVIVCIDFGARKVVGRISSDLDEACVVVGKLSQWLGLVTTANDVLTGNESIKLFLLVSMSMILHKNGWCHVLEQFHTEVVILLQSDLLATRVVTEIGVDVLHLCSLIGVLVE